MSIDNALASQINVQASVHARLRSRSFGLVDALQPLVRQHRDEMTRAVATGDADFVHARAAAMEQELLECVAGRYDALDRAVHESAIPIAEIDRHGIICYANNRFADIVPTAIGSRFDQIFPRRNASVASALRSGDNVSLRVALDEHGERRQFRAEIGPLCDKPGCGGNWALLLDVSAEEQRMTAALNAIIRVDRDACIVFINPSAEALIGAGRGALLDTPIEQVFTDLPAERIRQWLSDGVGYIDKLTLAGSGTPVSVAAMPFFEQRDRQLGTLLSFVSIADEIAQERLKHWVAADIEPLERIRNVIREVRKVVPFDFATVGVYTHDRKHFQALVAEPQPKWRWSTRWFDLSPGVFDWLDLGRTWDADMRAFIDTTLPGAAYDPVVRCIQESAINRDGKPLPIPFVTLPVRGAGKEFRSALTLMSWTGKSYNADDLERLRALDLEQVLQTCLEAIEWRREADLRDLKATLSTAANGRELADRLAEGVAKSFGWEYVGVMRVDRARNEFVLYSQFDRLHGPLTVPADWRQELHCGMLGHALREEAVLIAADVNTVPPPYDFVKTAEGQASAIVVPIKVNGRIELLLDIESSDVNAFQGDEKRLVEELTADCQQIFETRWQQAMNLALINAMEQAVVVVDAAGAIRILNGAALRLPGHAVGAILAELGTTEEDRAALRSVQFCTRKDITLGPDPAHHVRTMAMQVPLNDDHGHRLWLFTIPAEERQEDDWLYLDRTVVEVARQARAPLQIAEGLLNRAAGLLAAPNGGAPWAALLRRASQQLGKADFTFERLAGTLAAHRPPEEAKHAFDALALLHRAIAMLPDDEAASIRIDHAPGEGFIVAGWPDRLAFALRSLISYLLLDRVPDTRIEVASAVGADGCLTLGFTSALPPSEPVPAWPLSPDPAERARQVVTLAPEAVQETIHQHDGTVQWGTDAAQRLTVWIRLPPAPAEAGAA